MQRFAINSLIILFFLSIALVIFVAFPKIYEYENQPQYQISSQVIPLNNLYKVRSSLYLNMKRNNINIEVYTLEDNNIPRNKIFEILQKQEKEIKKIEKDMKELYNKGKYFEEGD